jgi:hypothetical protein
MERAHCIIDKRGTLLMPRDAQEVDAPALAVSDAGEAAEAAVDRLEVILLFALVRQRQIFRDDPNLV